MFGKTRDINDTDTLDSSAIDEFFGDEAAAATSAEIHDLRDRVEQVESQINSQFTSLATYAQIAQEQVELARAEARAATERSEQRVTSLIEREPLASVVLVHGFAQNRYTWRISGRSFSGWLAERLDYAGYFALTALFALPAFASLGGGRRWIED